MPERKVHLSLNCRKACYQPVIEGLHVGDTASCTLIVTLQDGSKPVDLSHGEGEAIVAVMQALKPDGTTICNRCEISGDTIIYQMGVQDTACAGYVCYQLVVSSVIDNTHTVMYSADFKTAVSENVCAPVYELLTEQPSDWSTNFRDYFQLVSGDYVPVTGDSAPTFAQNTYYRSENPQYPSLTQYQAFYEALARTEDAITNDLPAAVHNYLMDHTELFTGYTKAQVDALLMRRFVSVKDYGAKGNGTADDTEAVKQAIQNNKVVLFPAGTYKISGLTFDNIHDLTIIACGAVIEGEQGAGGNAIFKFSNSSNIVIDGGTFKGADKVENNVVVGGKAKRGLAFANTQNVVLNGVTVKNIGNLSMYETGGITFTGNCSFTTLNNVTVDGVTAGRVNQSDSSRINKEQYIYAHGIGFMRGSHSRDEYSRHVVINNPVIRNIGYSNASNTEFWVPATMDAKVEETDPTVYRVNGYAVQNDIVKVTGESPNVQYNARIDGDGIHLVQSHYDGTLQQGESKHDGIESYITIKNPHITNCSKRAIKAAARCVDIIGGYIDVATWTTAIDVQRVRNSSIQNVTIRDTTYTPVGICGGDGQMLIKDCTITGGGTSRTVGVAGITLGKKSAGVVDGKELVTIEGCVIDNVNYPVLGDISANSEVATDTELLEIKDCVINHFGNNAAIKLSADRFNSIDCLKIENIVFMGGKTKADIFAANRAYNNQLTDNANAKLLDIEVSPLKSAIINLPAVTDSQLSTLDNRKIEAGYIEIGGVLYRCDEIAAPVQYVELTGDATKSSGGLVCTVAHSADENGVYEFNVDTRNGISSSQRVLFTLQNEIEFDTEKVYRVKLTSGKVDSYDGGTVKVGLFDSSNHSLNDRLLLGNVSREIQKLFTPSAGTANAVSLGIIAVKNDESDVEAINATFKYEVWNLGEYKLAPASEQVTELSANSTDRQIPTAKAVVDAVGAATEEVNAAIPTKVSQLENDSGYLTSHQDISGKADKATTLSGYGITDAQAKIDSSHKLSSDLVDDTAKTNKFVTASEKSTWSGKYEKPSGGIPKSDLASAVQTSLGKADSALQAHQDISGKANASDVYTKSQVYTKTEVDNKGYLTAHQDISGKANASDVYTKAQVDALVDPYTVPSYWSSALSTAIGKVDALQRAHGADCINLVWFSDIHLMESLRNSAGDNLGKKIPVLSKALCDALDIPLVLFTGDAATNSIESTEAAMRNDFDYFNEITKPINDKLINCFGNHDGAWGDNRNGSTGYQAAYAWHIPPRDYWNDLIRKQTIGADRHYSEDGSYGYIDLPAQKLRIVQLNSFWVGDNDTYNQDDTMVYDYMHHGGYGQDQLDWLADEALSFDEDGWSVLFMAHMPPASIDGTDYTSASNNRDATVLNGILSAYATGGSYTGLYSYSSGRNEGSWANVSVNVDFSSAAHKAYPVAFLAGHCHKSKIDTTTLPFPIITITCATNSSYDSNEGTRTAGTATETAFDVISICKDTKTLYLTRLGVGSDRSTPYTTIVPVVNQVPISTDENGDVYNSTGYKDGYRFNSSNAETAATGYFTTGLIPVTEGSVVSLDGFDFPQTNVSGGANANYCRLIVVKSDKTVVSSATSSVIAGYTGSVVESNNLKTLVINSTAHSIYNNAAYIRLSGYGSGANAEVYVE